MIRYTLLLFSLLPAILCNSQSLPNFKATVYDPSLTGYYFLSPSYSGITLFSILDHSGNMVYYKPLKQERTVPYNFSLNPNGLISYSDHGKYLLMDSTFKIVDSVECKNIDKTDPHDMRMLPNGHYLLLGADTDIVDLRKDSIGKQFDTGDTLIAKRAVIQELDANKNVVFDWRAKDHFAIADADTFLFGILMGMLDVEHVNAVEHDVDGNILFSSRNFNEITKINRTDGSIIWRLGGKRNQFTLVNCPVPFYTQHDIRRLSNGHITLFDNGHYVVDHGARALEFELDETNKIATLKWSYVYDSSMQSGGHGNVQRLPGFKTLINFGGVSNDIIFVVVDSTGNKIFQLSSPDHLDSYRSFYYPSLPWKVHRPQITCFDSLGVKYLRTEKCYSSYSWSDSSTTSVIAVTKPGSYSLFVPYGEGGFISSEKFVVSDISHPCGMRHYKKSGNKKRKVL